jgi:hypothetical protein
MTIICSTIYFLSFGLFRLLVKGQLLYAKCVLIRPKIDEKLAQLDLVGLSRLINTMIMIIIETRSQCASSQINMGGMANEILSRHFSRPIFEDYSNQIFGKIQYLGYINIANKINSGNNRNSAVS